MSQFLTGEKELKRAFANIGREAGGEIARRMALAGGEVLLREIRNRVPSPYKNAKRAFGVRADGNGAKVGAGVGASNRLPPERSGKNKTGVGISGKTIHWFVAGTEKMRPIMDGVVRDASVAARAAVLEAMRREGFKLLQKAG